MVEISTIYLLDAAGTDVEGQLHDAIENAHINDWLTRWAPQILMRIQRLARQGVPNG
jgi:hypothetical protein